MSDTSIAIKIAGDSTQAHTAAWSSDDETWVKQLSDSGKIVRIRIPDDADTEGHESSAAVTVLVDADDDDVEGHALSLHFPSVQEANDFRRNLLAAGLLTATLAVGAAGGAAIGMAASGTDVNAPTAVVSQYAPNVGQYDPANMGGTAAALQQSAGLGQADPANMGGTLAPSAASLGQADPANMGGTLAPSAASLGQADPANMGGTLAPRRAASVRPIRPTWAARSHLGWEPRSGRSGQHGRHHRARQGSLGQADPANMGGTIASDRQPGSGRSGQSRWHAAVERRRRGGDPTVDPARDLTRSRNRQEPLRSSGRLFYVQRNG